MNAAIGLVSLVAAAILLVIVVASGPIFAIPLFIAFAALAGFFLFSFFRARQLTKRGGEGTASRRRQAPSTGEASYDAVEDPADRQFAGTR
jgi:phosphatidylglycerophosphate synthase